MCIRHGDRTYEAIKGATNNVKSDTRALLTPGHKIIEEGQGRVRYPLNYRFWRPAFSERGLRGDQ